MDKLDILNREEFVEKLFNLTQQLSFNKKKASFAIDGSWGVGKSFVLDMYEEKLSQEQSEETNKDRYFVIRYNCWKYDYYEEPLIAIVSAMIETIEQKTKLFPDNEKKSKILGGLKAVGLSLLSMANSAIRQKTGVDLKKAYGVIKDGVDEGAKSYEENHDYDVYFGFNKVMNALKKSIEEISSEYTVIILVDELDRCLPEYSIKVLERLHHINEGSANIVNVISIDKTQLYTNIQHIFGFSDVDLYLKKFIQFTISLDAGKISERIIDKYSDYISLFDSNLYPVNDSIEEYLQEIFRKIDAREQERIVERANIAHTLLFSEPKSTIFMCMELLITVVNSCYQSNKAFCQWLEKFSRTRELNKKNPPFSQFFDERFKELPHRQIRNAGITTSTSYEFIPNVSLYANVFYLWYKVFLDGGNTEISIEDKELKHNFSKYIADLKRFNETIKFIK